MNRAAQTRTTGAAVRYGAGLWLAAAVCAVAGAIDWTELGPAPIVSGQYTGRVSAVVCSPSDPNRYFVGGADGGVWRTTDGGASWTPLTGHLPSSAIGALALDPTNENIVYAGTGEANYANHSRYGLGLYKSTDGGETWEVLAADVFAGRCFSKIMIDPQNPNRIYAAITRAGGFPELAAAKGHPDATGPLGLFRSDDAGVTWTHLTNGLPSLSATDVALNPASPNVVYAAIGRIFGSTENGIYKSTDGGDSWTATVVGGISTIGRISVSVAPSQPSRLYTLITRKATATGGGASVWGVYRSDDDGGDWVPLASLTGMQATYGWYLSVVAVHPTDPDTVFMGGVTFYRSTTAGASWSSVTPPHVDMHAATWDAAGRLVVGDDGGVHRSSTGGSTWETINSGLGVIQCYAGLSTHPADDGIMFVGLQDNGSVRLTGGSWTQVFGGDGGWTQVDQSDPSYVFVENQGTGNLFRASDGGWSFSYSGSGISSGDRNCFLPPYLFDPSNPLHMIYGTHRIYLSTNRGSSWSPYSGDITGGGSAAIRSLARAPSDPDIVYAATNDGRLLRSSDGGASFELKLEDVPGWPRVTREIFVHPADPQTVYLAVAQFGETQIRRTRDGGQTWEALDASFPDLPVNVLAVDVRGIRPVIYAGTDETVYRSLNEGASWHRYGSGLSTAAVIDLRLQPERGRLIAATQGRGVWTIAVGLPGDMNGDGSVNGFDIDPFVLALTDPDGYAAQYPDMDPILVGDMNGDGVLDAFDIDGFVEVLTG